jgi:methyl-accepting chemotaxis protein
MRMKKISTKIFLATLAAGVGVGIVCLAANFVILTKVSNDDIASLEHTLRDDYDKLIKSEVETVITILDRYGKLYESGIYTKEEAESQAAAVVRDLRYNNNYFWIDTSKGDNVVFLGSKIEGTNRFNEKDMNGTLLIQGIIKQALAGGGYFNYAFPREGETEAKPKRSYSAYYQPFDWVVGTGNYIDDIDLIITEKKEAHAAVIRQSMIAIAGILLIVVILAIIVSIILGRNISRPVRSVASVLKSLSTGEGDLTGRLPVLSEDEVGDLSISYNTFLDRLSKIVRSINETMQQAVNLKEIMTNATQETFSALHEISSNAASMNEQMKILDDTAAKAASAVAQINTNILSLDSSIENQSSAVEEATASVKQIVTALKSVSDITNQKSSASRLLAEASQKGKHDVENTRSVIKSISENIGTINDMVSVINSIAAQTNLLAMNASIESAHAGEAGKGFGVVASEIRKLAETSSQNAKNISDRLKDILKKIDEADTSSEQSLKVIEKVNIEVQETAKSFEEILAHSEELSQGGEQILIAMTALTGVSEHVRENSAQMKSESDTMNTIVDNVTDISRGAATGMGEIATGSHEITESMGSIHNNMGMLADLTDKLSDEVSKFKIEKDAEQTAEEQKAES